MLPARLIGALVWHSEVLRWRLPKHHPPFCTKFKVPVS
jgi:hypothetical protein